MNPVNARVAYHSKGFGALVARHFAREAQGSFVERAAFACFRPEEAFRRVIDVSVTLSLASNPLIDVSVTDSDSACRQISDLVTLPLRPIAR